jgi:hypothetical protein
MAFVPSVPLWPAVSVARQAEGLNEAPLFDDLRVVSVPSVPLWPAVSLGAAGRLAYDRLEGALT